MMCDDKSDAVGVEARGFEWVALTPIPHAFAQSFKLSFKEVSVHSAIVVAMVMTMVMMMVMTMVMHIAIASQTAGTGAHLHISALGLPSPHLRTASSMLSCVFLIVRLNV